MDNDQRDELIFQTHGLVAGMAAKLTAVEKRMDDHTGRITLIEADVKVHSHWRSKMTGAWIAGSLLAAALGTLAALAVSMLRR